MNEEKIEKGTLSYEEIKNIKFGEPVYSVKIIGDSINVKENNNKVTLLIRKGENRPPNNKYNWYPYWALSIEGEDGQVVTWTPTRNLFERIIEQVFIHEERVDRTRTNRERDVPIWKKKLEVIVNSIQKKLFDLDIPPIYFKQKKEEQK